jgi:cytochrome oxidase Cu insertion factor (SCO1/SenC/PrrC family)
MNFSRKVSRPLWLVLIVGPALLLAAAGGMATSQPIELPMGLTEVKPATPMPAFNLPGVDGAAFDSSSLQGKVVVVRFWATW